MSVDNVLNAAIYSQLTGGTALVAALGGTARTEFPGGIAVSYLQAPDNVQKPFVVWSFQAGGDENITPNRTNNKIVLVRSFADSAAQAGSIDALVDARLHMQTLNVSGWTNFWLARETEVSLVENLPNVEKSYMSGAMYRCRLDQN
jgi:hypothetical protein